MTKKRKDVNRMIDKSLSGKFEIILYKGKECLYRDIRLTNEQLKLIPDDVNIYQIRHMDEDWGEPVSIEPIVVSNYFGTIFTKEKLKFKTNTRIPIEADDLIFTGQPSGLEFFN